VAVVIPLNNFLGPADDTVTAQTYYRIQNTEYHQTNGQADRVNKTMEEALRIFVQGQPKTWPHRLGMFKFAYNSSRHSTTGMAPFQLLYGEIQHTPASLIHGPSPRSQTRAGGRQEPELRVRPARGSESTDSESVSGWHGHGDSDFAAAEQPGARRPAAWIHPSRENKRECEDLAPPSLRI